MEPTPPVSPSWEEEHAAFERVWRRVMPEDRPDCPFTLSPQPPDTSLPAIQTASETALSGSAATSYRPFLQEMIRRETTLSRICSLLSRRLARASARQAARLSTEAKQTARRLSAFYFLISGVRYLPEESPSVPPGTAAALLRCCFASIQDLGVSYQLAAQHCSDELLASLFSQLAQRKTIQRSEILSLAEQL
jgi:hypothetical protein